MHGSYVINYDVINLPLGDCKPDAANAEIFVRPVDRPTIILANSGDDVTLTCDVQSRVVRWDKQDNSGLFQVLHDEFGSTLTFTPAVFGDEGMYRCAVPPEGFGNQISTSRAFIAGIF